MRKLPSQANPFIVMSRLDSQLCELSSAHCHVSTLMLRH